MDEAGILPINLDLSGNFDAQVQHILERVRLTKQEVDQLNLLYMHLQRTLHQKWPGCKVVPFGSIVTGLGIKTSDVDCYVDILDGTFDIDNPDTVMEARRVLRKKHWLFQNTFAIAKAKVPIVKFVHVPTGVHCDLNFKSASGVRNSRLLELLLNFDRRALTLAVLLKYWAKVHKLTGTNLMSNYSLTLLVIFFLQQVKLLPPVEMFQNDNEMFIIDNWNTALNDNAITQFVCESDMSVFELMGQFFTFYSNIDFDKNILSVYSGQLIPRTCFQSVEHVPVIFDLYKNNVSNEICTPLKIDTMICIQDPFEHNRNCTVSIFPKLAILLISHFQLAAKIYKENNKDQFLPDVLSKKVSNIQALQRNKANVNRFKKPDEASLLQKMPILNGKITKSNKKRKKGTQNSLTILYQQTLKNNKKSK